MTDTNLIYEKITGLAIEEHRESLWSAWEKFKINIDMPNDGYYYVEVSPVEMDGKSKVKVLDVIEELFEQLQDSRKRRIEVKAVDDFLKSVETFRKQLEILEISRENL